MKFKIFSSRKLRGRRWYFRGIATNGEPILQSEGYRNHADCLKTVRLIQREASGAIVDDSEA